MSIFHRSAWKSMCVSGDVSISVIDCSAKLLPVCAECQKQYRKFWNQWNETRFLSSLSLGNTLYEPALFLLFSQVRDIYRKERSRLCPRTVFVRAAKLHLLSSGLLLGFPNRTERITHWLWHGFRIKCECYRLFAVVATLLCGLFEFGSVMNHRQFSHCIFTRPNF